MPQSGKLPVLNLLTGQIRGFSPRRGRLLDIFWDRIPTPAPIEVEFSTAKRTQVSVGHAIFDVNRAAGKPVFFWPVSKFNSGTVQAVIMPLTVTGHCMHSHLSRLVR